MKFLKNFEGKILTKNEQKEINGGSLNCRGVSSLSWGGCTVSTSECYNDYGSYMGNSNVYTCSGGYRKEWFEPIT